MKNQMTANEFRQAIKLGKIKQEKGKLLFEEDVQIKENKIVKGARKYTTIDGFEAPSELEGKAYDYLKERGIKFNYQYKIILQPSFKYQNKTVKAITWTIDFKIWIDKKNYIFLDTKGHATQTALLKMKLFKYKFPHEVLIILRTLSEVKAFIYSYGTPEMEKVINHFIHRKLT